MNSIKLIPDPQAYTFSQYKNLKPKVFKCSANLCFYARSLKHNLTKTHWN